ncbi:MULTISPECIES: hypothetical protein [Lactobacillus]|uniref:hypothetical protein n=1 Tax=Lactobacillus TaxID=1578 RepID=UPI0013145B90|nr:MULTISPECIES: hypothetical protein [Lactobacillus]
MKKLVAQIGLNKIEIEFKVIKDKKYKNKALVEIKANEAIKELDKRNHQLKSIPVRFER